MKKVLTILLAAMMVFSISAVDAVAADTKNVEVTYGVDQSFEWTVPTDEIDPSASGESVTISVSGSLIPTGKQLDISVDSGNSYKLKCGTDEIAYEIKSGTAPSELTWGADTIILSVKSGTATGSVTGTIKVTGTATKAGTYKDTLTFTAEINSQKQN